MRIVELSTFVAAPLGGMTLAQLGADVIRVDPVGGAADISRWPVTESGTSLFWTGLNKGKRSVELDLRTAGGRELLVRLVAEAGILLTNAANRPWLDFAELRGHRDDLIVVRVEGHPDGRTAVDYTVNAALGFPLITGPEGHEAPVNHVLPAWDVACGLHAALAVLVADRRRRATGVGEHVRIALYDVALATAANLGLLAEAQVNGVTRQRAGNYLYGTFARDFRTSDARRVMIVALTGRQWKELLDVTGFAATFAGLAGVLGADFASERDRYRYREVIAGVLSPWFAARTLTEVGEVLTGTSLPWSAYRSFTELLDLPELTENPLMAEVDQRGVGRHLAPSSPLRFETCERIPPSPAPSLGEHTHEVLAELLGLVDDDFPALHRDEAVG